MRRKDERQGPHDSQRTLPAAQGNSRRNPWTTVSDRQTPKQFHQRNAGQVLLSDCQGIRTAAHGDSMLLWQTV